MTATNSHTDVLAVIASIEPGSRLASLRAARSSIGAATQATFESIFEPADETAFTRIEREVAALWSATLAKAPAVASFHRARLIRHGAPAEHLAALGASVDDLDLTARERAILRHVDLLTLRPDTADERDIDMLLNVGLTPAAIVALTHLVAFLAFEIRIIAILQAMDQGNAQ